MALHRIIMRWIYGWDENEIESNFNEKWIALMEKRDNAKRIHLKHNLRNSKTILNLADFLSDYDNMNKVSLIPNKNITGHVCYHYHNIHKLDKVMLARAAILKYFPRHNESVLVLAYTSAECIEYIYNDLKKH